MDKSENKKFAYYPGCSLKGSAGEFDESVRSVFEELGITLEEIPDWNCCGATSAHNLSRDLALSLSLRNLAIAEPSGLDVVAPCASCYNRLKVAEATVLGDADTKKRIEKIIERKFNGDITTLNGLDLLVDHIGMDKVRSRVTRKLEGLKVVSYYGCLLVRPRKLLGVQEADNPMALDDLMEALGAEPKFWSFKTDCCGAGHALSRTDIVCNLVGNLQKMALEAGAEAIVTACPMCHANLDMRQSDSMTRVPVFFFSELMALAMGKDREAKKWIGKHHVPAVPLFEKLGLL